MAYEKAKVSLKDTYFRLECGCIVHRSKAGKKKGDLLFCTKHANRFPITASANRYL